MILALPDLIAPLAPATDAPALDQGSAPALAAPTAQGAR